MHAQLIAVDLPVTGIRVDLERYPKLWDVRPLRTGMKGGPFEGTSDIWLRFRDWRTVTEPKQWGEPHEPIWYPEAQILPGVEYICDQLMHDLECDKLGGVLITRIPPGGEVKWHSDLGGWHAGHYNRKVYVILQGDENCVNEFEDQRFMMRTGEAWLFNNLVQHRVVHKGIKDRISLIVCMRKENVN